MKKKVFQKSKKFNPMLQVTWLMKSFPQFNWEGRNGKFIFSGEITPTNESQTYNIEIWYEGNNRPKVFVKNKILNSKCKHIFDDKSLCLYHKNDFKFNEDIFIADTIIPWTSAWLYFYEFWEQTGIWYGEEYPHEEVKCA